MIINTVFTGSSIWALNDLPAVTVPLPALWVGLSIGTARRSNTRQRPKMLIGLEGAHVFLWASSAGLSTFAYIIGWATLGAHKASQAT